MMKRFQTIESELDDILASLEKLAKKLQTLQSKVIQLRQELARRQMA